MVRFSASDVALTGFGVVRRRPVVLPWWILLHLIFMGVTSALLLTIAGPALTQLMALQAQHTPTDPATQAQTFALFHQILPLYLVMIPIMLAFYAVLFAAMNRAVLRPAKSAFGYLRLGVDEWRQFLLFLWAMVVALGAYIALVVIGAIVAIIGIIIFAMVNKGAGATGAGAGTGAATLGVIAFVLIYMIAYIYVLVRLSLASAMTFDTGKVSLLKSWRLTKGRFWSMFGAYFLAAVLSIVVSLLGLIVMYVAAMLVGGVGGLGFIFRPDMSSPAAYFTPARLVYLVLGGGLYALVWPVLLTPSAAIYKALTAAPDPTPAAWPTPYPEPLTPEPPPSPPPVSSPTPPESPPPHDPDAAALGDPAPP